MTGERPTPQRFRQLMLDLLTWATRTAARAVVLSAMLGGTLLVHKFYYELLNAIRDTGSGIAPPKRSNSPMPSSA